MNIHEYQAKAVLREFGVPVPKGIVAHSPDEAAAAFRTLGGPLAVVKAQIHAGGRGKGKFLIAQNLENLRQTRIDQFSPGVCASSRWTGRVGTIHLCDYWFVF